MSRFLVSLIANSRRAYSALAAESAGATENARRRAAAGMMMAAESGESAKKEIFWMRDPKTGNWIPENRFNDVDPADLRARFLGKN